MAVLIEGLQGSGKSYYASYRMLYDEKKYYRMLTNIDGIKETEKIKPLDFKNFTDKVLNECYRIQVENDGSFEECIKYLQNVYILPKDVSENNRVLLVVDEAQNYFGKSVKLSPTLSWFITQHRHLFIELYLITQKYTLLRPEYHLFNLILKAYPPIKQFSKSKIRYREYAGLPLNEENLSRKFSIPKEQKIFDMYISGDKVESPNILKKWAWLFILIGLFLLGAVAFFLSSFSGTSQPTEAPKSYLESQEATQHIQEPNRANRNKQTPISKRLYTFVVWEDGYFYIKEIGKTEYPINILKYIKETYFIKVVENIRMSKYRTLVYVVCNTDLEKLLRKEEEKKENRTGFETFRNIQ